ERAGPVEHDCRAVVALPPVVQDTDPRVAVPVDIPDVLPEVRQRVPPADDRSGVEGPKGGFQGFRGQWPAVEVEASPGRLDPQLEGLVLGRERRKSRTGALMGSLQRGGCDAEGPGVCLRKDLAGAIEDVDGEPELRLRL